MRLLRMLPVLLLAACGQAGDLYLPPPPPPKPAAAPAAETPAETPPEAKSGDKDKK